MPGTIAKSYLIVWRQRGSKLRAFQRWFQIESGSIIKETVLILVSYDKTGSLQTVGGALIRGGALKNLGRLWLAYTELQGDF